MPEGVLALIVLPLVKLNGGIGVYRPVKFNCLAVDAASQHVACQCRRDALSNLKSGHALFVLAHGTVRKCDLYHSRIV